MAGTCLPIKFAGLIDGAFYFDDFPQDDMDTDTFKLSMTNQCLIRSYDNKVLILDDAQQFNFQNRNDVLLASNSDQLRITFYKDLNEQLPRGRAVILHALKNDVKYTAVCKNEKEVCAEAVQELHRDIDDSGHKALFVLTMEDSSKMFKLRSTKYPQMVLGFDETDSNKLILRVDDPSSEFERFTISLIHPFSG